MQITKTIAEYASYFLEGAAILVIIVGAVQSIYLYVRRGLLKKTDLALFMQTRLKLGQSLSLALGFLVGADIIKTAISPSWQEIGQLGAIVVIRIVLNFFLTRDMKQMEGLIKG
ncbi:MAG: DUF1622 domain-containing protein [Candidatus Aminicenantaceae bacterium]